MTDPVQSRAELPAINISDAALQKFCDFLYRKTGIRLDEKKRYFLERRLAERARQADCASFAEYFAVLKYGRGTELQRVIDDVTVNETYFWRENYQFECMTRGMLDEIAPRKRAGERIRIWSLPCSTGEEPYTIAIHILEHWAQADAYDIEIYASDIDHAALKRAESGIYEERALSRLPQAYRSKYFERLDAKRWQVSGFLRDSIEFSPVNISDPGDMARFPLMDIVFCRNLLIYFDDTSRRHAAQNMFDLITPGGFVCLGHSESMSRISNIFQPRQFKDALVYQKGGIR
jgi:chemotaxis protein methyltransferase CheR